MDEEISAIKHEKLRPYHSLTVVAEGLPALGIVAAVLGVIKAMRALDQSPELLGGLIGAALVGTFAGVFTSYAIVSPLANKIKAVRVADCYVYVIIKQTLLAFMNGAMPQVAIEHGRKSIPSHERPTIDEVENETLVSGSIGAAEAA
jgi:chemotaxis protein MotA